MYTETETETETNELTYDKVIIYYLNGKNSTLFCEKNTFEENTNYISFMTPNQGKVQFNINVIAGYKKEKIQ